jgi:hypothetical protein
MNRINIIFLVAVLMLVTISLSAQDKKKNKDKPENKGINTNYKTPVKYIEFIPGTWKMDGIFKGDKDVSNNDTLGLGQVIEFNREGRFTSHTDGEKIDSGAYRLNEEHAILYLESVNGAPVAEWNISFTKNQMTLWPRDRADKTERLKYVYSRGSGN